jgi:hypothetical protein
LKKQQQQIEQSFPKEVKPSSHQSEEMSHRYNQETGVRVPTFKLDQPIPPIPEFKSPEKTNNQVNVKQENQLFDQVGKSLTKSFVKQNSPQVAIITHELVPKQPFSPNPKSPGFPASPLPFESPTGRNSSRFSLGRSAEEHPDEVWQQGEELTTNHLSAILSKMQVKRLLYSNFSFCFLIIFLRFLFFRIGCTP